MKKVTKVLNENHLKIKIENQDFKNEKNVNLKKWKRKSHKNIKWNHLKIIKIEKSKT